jgi:hypothetical protein
MAAEQAPLAFAVGNVSARHCHLQILNEGIGEDVVYQVEDLRSKHGMFIDGSRAAEAILRPGARIGAGDLVLELRAPDVKPEGARVRGVVGVRPPPEKLPPRLSTGRFDVIRRRVELAEKERRPSSVAPGELAVFARQSREIAEREAAPREFVAKDTPEEEPESPAYRLAFAVAIALAVVVIVMSSLELLGVTHLRASISGTSVPARGAQ